MFPLWDIAIAPVLRAARAKRVVEIGALRGETTVRMLDDLSADAELHVIDPVPDFDPREHERQFPGRYYFHEALSLDVIPTLEPMDAALIDGDHNWYTVYHELRLLAEGARRGGAPLPLLVMHDVLWPYGRRDLYYSPEQIPEEFRQPYAQQGMRPGARKLLKRGGLNPTMFNALEEGGPRNGVMTALDDFVAGHDKPLRVLVLPIYFGLAIVAEEERLARQPELAAEFDRLEGPDGRLALMELAEEVRLRAMIFQHNVYFDRDQQLDRARARHLKVFKAALLNEHYLDHEVRFAHLTNHLIGGTPRVDANLRDPARHEETFRQLERDRTGPGGPEDANATSFLPYTAMGRPQLDHLERTLDAVTAAQVPGDLVECGTGRGGGAIFMRGYLDAYEIADRSVWAVDHFRASEPPRGAPQMTRSGVAGFWPDLNLVRDGFARFDLLDDRVRFLEGPFSGTLQSSELGALAVLRIGRSAVGDVREILDATYDRVSPAGTIIIDVGAESWAEAEDFRAERGISAPLERIDSSAVSWRRVGGERPGPDRAATLAESLAHPPLIPAAPSDGVDLSVVVVMYNMRREAARTLHSLSRRYQEQMQDVTYEVIVVENGSDADQLLGEEYVQGFGTEFRYIDMGDGAHPSPAVALNRGIRAATGGALALMIDGAHVLTPGVLHYGMKGLATYAPAIVATQQWYVGPGQQGEAMDNGYDQDYEDRLFTDIKWPGNGYRLFEIGHFVGDRDWLDGMWESNCMFVSRPLLEQVGGFDESFAEPGGGYANLELYERLGSSPDITVATILGEGSFHQVHGGTTTNQPDPDERRGRVFGYSEHYRQLRGRAFRGPGKPIHYVGRITTGAARRTKPRRLTTDTFRNAAHLDDGRPTTPIPVPDELTWAFVEAVWDNMAWKRTTWLGRGIDSAPTDLIAYQEMIATIRPDWVIETGTGDGARALFLASICEIVGHGQVLSIDTKARDDRPDGPRLQYLTGEPDHPTTVEQVRAIVGDGRAIVVLGGCVDRVRTVREFRAYSTFVPAGSYVVVANTVVNGHPVWTSFGPGPAEAVKQILNMHGDFVADPAMEKYSLTFNPSGFLKRLTS